MRSNPESRNLTFKKIGEWIPETQWEKSGNEIVWPKIQELGSEIQGKESGNQKAWSEIHRAGSTIQEMASNCIHSAKSKYILDSDYLITQSGINKLIETIAIGLGNLYMSKNKNDSRMFVTYYLVDISEDIIEAKRPEGWITGCIERRRRNTAQGTLKHIAFIRLVQSVPWTPNQGGGKVVIELEIIVGNPIICA